MNLLRGHYAFIAGEQSDKHLPLTDVEVVSLLLMAQIKMFDVSIKKLNPLSSKLLFGCINFA